MNDEINDSQEAYNIGNLDQLKTFVDAKVAARVDEINSVNMERLERFRLDALKNREIYTAHFNDKPDPKLFDTTDNLKVWHEKCLELEGRALKFERQYEIFKEKLELGTDDLIKRAARKDVAKQHPEKYQRYLTAKKIQADNKLTQEWGELDSKLDNLIANNATSKEISTVTSKLDAVVRRLEKSEIFQNSATKESRNSLQNTKAKIEKANSVERNNGLEL